MQIKRVIILILAALTIACSTQADAAVVHYLKVDGIINPVVSEFITKGITAAEKDRAEAIVIQIDTPGGLDLSMRDIVKAMLASEVPVVIYVAPPGSRAASAGLFITYAAHIAAMAPSTNIGSAHPVAMGGEKMDETMVKKVENDAVAYIQGIAEKRGRNAEWAEKAVRESVNVTAEEAVKLNVIDLIAPDREALFEAIDGREVEVVSGKRSISIKGAEVVEVEMGLRYRILKAISNPNVAYVLMMLGMVGLYFELSNPGAILPGVIGGICIILAFYSFQTLSVNYAGLALIILAAIFFVAEVLVTSYGLLAISGVVALTLGSLMLFDSPLPFMRLSLWVLLPTVTCFAAIFLAIMYYAVRIQRRRPFLGIGSTGLIGEEGLAETDISPEGKIFLDGEYWEAWSDEPIKSGERVRVIEIKGLKVKVQTTGV
ncbi:MAG: nodulation protein NfeD [Deltaproteobacteria bacterium]|nr:nodulation protein NfeD [Deltaproteobacteria bacterium]